CIHPHLHSFPTRRSSDLAVERASDLLFGRRESGTFDVGRLAQQQLDSLIADFADTRDVHDLTFDRSQVELEVAREKYNTDRSLRSEEHTSELQSRFDLVC